jgi:hypothetical protein
LTGIQQSAEHYLSAYFLPISFAYLYSTEFKSVWFGDARNQVLNSLLLRLDVYI